jgi:hypothetical protein
MIVDSINTPTHVPNLPPIIDFACGFAFLLALDEKGTLYGWGYNLEGQHGCGQNRESAESDTINPSVTPGTKFTKIFAGSYHALGLTENGDLYTWGWNEFGQLGLKGQLRHDKYSPVLCLQGVREVVAGGSFCVALMEGGELMSWGKNDSGQLGLENQDHQDVPQKVTAVPGKILSFGCGYEFSYFFTECGLFFCGNSRIERITYGSAQKIVSKVELESELQIPKGRYKAIWEKALIWIFLGRRDPGSEFSALPVEAVYEFVRATMRNM